MLINILIFIIVNFLVLYNSFLILKKFSIKKNEDKILSLGVLSISQIILSLLIFGIMKLLYAWNVLFLFLCLTILLSFLNRKKYFPKNKEIKKITKSFIKSILKMDFCLQFSIIALIFTLFLILFFGLILPPYSHDGLEVHLPMAVEWLKSHDVHLVKLTTFTDVNVAMHYPGNAELILLWNSLFLFNDIIVDLTQLAFAVLGGVACYCISRRLGVNKKHALWSLILFILTPIVILQSKTTYNDVIFASLFLMSISFLLSYEKEGKKIYIILSALSFGILLGTKYLGLLYLPIYILFFILYYPSKKLSKKFFVIFFIILILIFSTGGYWYLRNFLEKGSIIYPMKVKILGYTIMDAPQDPMTMFSWAKGKYVSSELEWFFYPFLDGIKTHGGYTYETGFGPQFISLMIPSLFLVFIKYRKKFFVLFLLLLVLFALSPVKDPRYFISILGIGAIAVSCCIRILKNSKTVEIIILFCIIFSIINSIPNFYICNGDFFKDKYELWLCTHSSYADGWKWINEHTNNENIVAITHFLYPLYGENFKNNIAYIPSDNYENWIKGLRKNRIKYIFMAPFSNYPYPIKEYEFIQKLRFPLIFGSKRVKIYLVTLKENKK